MLRALRGSWALFLGLGILMLGHGLQVTLLGVRAELEHFPAGMIGLVMSGYNMGFLVGSLIVPSYIRRVGHVRVFAAFVSIASTIILLHAVIVSPWSWLILRFITGVALCGVFVTCESWLNSSAGNEIRGQLLSAYMIVQLGALSAGQFLLNLAPPTTTVPFIVASILLSVAVVPILLVASPAPVVTTSREMSLRELYRRSPLAGVAIVLTGMATGAIWGVAAVYAQRIGLSVAGVSTFMAVILLGGMLFQWPLGTLSDALDRRLVITCAATAAGLLGITGFFLPGAPAWSLTLLFFVLTGLAMPLYSLCVAHANDNMSREEMLGASGALLLAFGIGSIGGPIAGGLAIQHIGAHGFPLLIGVIYCCLALFALARMVIRAPVPLLAQGPTLVLPAATATPVITTVAQEAAVERAPDNA